MSSFIKEKEKKMLKQIQLKKMGKQSISKIFEDTGKDQINYIKQPN